MAEVVHQEPERRERARAGRHDRLDDAHLGRQPVDVDRPGAAEPDQSEGSRVEPALDGHQPKCARHRGIGDLHDPERGRDDVHPERVGAAIADRAGRGVNVEVELAAEERFGAEPAEHEVRVGDRRLLAAAAVRGWSRLGAGADRADAQRAARVDPGDRAAAGADLGQLDDRRADRVARATRRAGARLRDRPDVVLLGDLRRPAADEPDLGRRAAHVERDRVGQPELAGEVAGRDDPGGGPRLDDEHRSLAGALEGQHAAAALHHQQLGLDPAAAQPFLDRAEVLLDDRLDPGVDHDGAGPVVLAELRDDVGRQRDRHVRALLAQDRPDPILVDGVGVGVQQADRDRLDAEPGERPGDRPDRVLVERDEHVAVPVEPLRDPEAQRPRDERDRLGELDVVQRRPDLAADLEDVAEALGRDQRGPRDLALDDRVGRHGRAMDDVAQAGRVGLRRRRGFGPWRGGSPRSGRSASS